MGHSRSTLSVQLENAQKMLRVAEQKFTTITETFEVKLVEIQRKIREEVKKEFDRNLWKCKECKYNFKNR